MKIVSERALRDLAPPCSKGKHAITFIGYCFLGRAQLILIVFCWIFKILKIT